MQSQILAHISLESRIPGSKKGKSQILKNLLRTLSLQRSKIWRLPILHYTPTPRISTALLPASHKLTQLPWLRTLYGVLDEVHAIKIGFHHCTNKIIFVSDKIIAKMSQKSYNE